MQYALYVIYSKAKDKYYVGHTEDLERRVYEHRIRKNLGTDDWEVVYTESFATRSEAYNREHQIKAKKRRSYMEQLIGKIG